MFAKNFSQVKQNIFYFYVLCITYKNIHFYSHQFFKNLIKSYKNEIYIFEIISEKTKKIFYRKNENLTFRWLFINFKNFRVNFSKQCLYSITPFWIYYKNHVYYHFPVNTCLKIQSAKFKNLRQNYLYNFIFLKICWFSTQFRE